MNAPESAVALSEFVHQRRKQLKLTYAAMAERCGVSEYTCKRIENCYGGLQWDSVRKILKGLNATLGEYAAWERGYCEDLTPLDQAGGA